MYFIVEYSSIHRGLHAIVKTKKKKKWKKKKRDIESYSHLIVRAQSIMKRERLINALITLQL